MSASTEMTVGLNREHHRQAEVLTGIADSPDKFFCDDAGSDSVAAFAFALRSRHTAAMSQRRS